MLLFVWLWRIFSGCYGVSLHSFVGCIAKHNGFLKTVLIANLVLELLILLKQVWNIEKRTCDSKIIFSCIVSEYINSWVYFQHKRL